jgi:tetratricopeptide (TPR) repeat protein
MHEGVCRTLFPLYFPSEDSSILTRHLIALFASLLLSNFSHASDEINALDKEFDVMSRECMRGKLHCADSYLKHLRNIEPASGGPVLQEQTFRIYLTAWMLQALGEDQDAEIEYKAALDLSKRTCDHRDEQTCAGIQWLIEANLAQLYIDEKRYEDAQALLLNAQSNKQKLGNGSSVLDDELVLISTRLGDALAGLGKYAEAGNAYLHAKSGIDARPSDWAHKHWEGWPGMPEEIFPDSLTIRMAALYRMEGDNDRALKLLDPILAKEHRAPIEEPTDIADACDEAAVAFANIRQEHQVEPLLRRAYEIRTYQTANECAVSWIDAKKLAAEMQGLARACRSDTCKDASATLAATAEKISAASKLHPYVLHENLCH